MTRPVGRLEGPFVELEGRLVEVEGPVVDLEGRLDEITGPLVEVEGPLVDLEGRLDGIAGPFAELEGPCRRDRRLSRRRPWPLLEVERRLDERAVPRSPNPALPPLSLGKTSKSDFAPRLF
jgi:hypothetical protein